MPDLELIKAKREVKDLGELLGQGLLLLQVLRRRARGTRQHQQQTLQGLLCKRQERSKSDC